MMTNELLIGLVGVAIAAVPWAMSIHAKVAVIAESVRALPEIVQQLRHQVESHEQRLAYHEQQIKTLKESANISS